MTSKRIVGQGTKSRLLQPAPEAILWQVPAGSDMDISAADQTVTVDTGFAVAELQAALKREGQCLPLPETGDFGALVAGLPGTVGGLLATNLPHGLSFQHGGPKEWLLQAEVLFQGEPAKAGARVVKSVAGYDVHKVFVGSRGVLGPIVRVTLRTWPVRAVKASECDVRRPWNGEQFWIARTLPSAFDKTLEQAQHVFAVDRPSCTLWAGAMPELPAEGWMVGPNGSVWSDNPNPELEQRLKSVFDPAGEWV